MTKLKPNRLRLTMHETFVIIKALEDAAEHWEAAVKIIRKYTMDQHDSKKLEKCVAEAIALAKKLEDYDETHTLMLVDEG